MTVPSPAPGASFAEIDALLASHPFGDSGYITPQTHLSYRRRLERIAETLPSAKALRDASLRDSEASYGLLGDPVIRCAIQHAHVRADTGLAYGLALQTCDALFAAASRLPSGASPLGGGLTLRLGPDRPGGWIWTEDVDDQVFSRAFREILELNYGDARPCGPTPGELANLRAGVALLDALLPLCSRSALSHTHLFVVFREEGSWASRMSSSEFRVSGAVFLSRRVLRDPWTVAEHVLHESLHQQIYDLRAGHELLIPEFLRPGAPLIHSLWNRPDPTHDSLWDVHRALAAFHVYVHLALLTAAAEASEVGREAHGPPTMVGRRTAAARAQYLSEQLRTVGWAELGPAGRRLVDWFDQILTLVNAEPPARGATVHLLLDRYWREAAELEVSFAPGPVPPALAARLRDLAVAEVEKARAVLALKGVPAPAFEEAATFLPEDDVLGRFTAVRQSVAETLLRLALPDFRLTPSLEADRAVTAMVEDSSEALMPFLEPGAAPRAAEAASAAP